MVNSCQARPVSTVLTFFHVRDNGKFVMKWKHHHGAEILLGVNLPAKIVGFSKEPNFDQLWAHVCKISR